jgi:hypothetical protein
VFPVSQDPTNQDPTNQGQTNQESAPIEDPYASLFRPEAPQSDPIEVPESNTPSETGRVFKSQGVNGHEEALLAVPHQKSSKLRTLTRDSQPHTDVIALDASAAGTGDSIVVSEIAMHMPAPNQSPSTSPVFDPEQSPHARKNKNSRQRSPGRSSVIDSLNAPWVYAITISVTVVFALGNVFLFNSQPGALTGIGLLGATIFVSFAVKFSDDIHAIYAPAIAFFIVAITVGQINFSGSGLINRGIEVFFILGQNWIWIIGSTVIALTIVALRRRSLR